MTGTEKPLDAVAEKAPNGQRASMAVKTQASKIACLIHPGMFEADPKSFDCRRAIAKHDTRHLRTFTLRDIGSRQHSDPHLHTSLI